MDNLTKEQRRKNMQAIRSSNTAIEKKLGKILWSKGLRYRKNDKTVLGRPDFVFKKAKVAVFCDGTFWHGKNWNQEKLKIKSNRTYWFDKIEKNIMRDKKTNKSLKKEGWLVVRFWADEINKHPHKCAVKVAQHVSQRTEKSR